MQGTFVNCLLSAIVGVIAAAGTTWYLAEHSAPEENAPTNLVESEQAAVKEVKELVVDSLIVNDSILLVDPETQTATLEIKDGSLFAKMVYTPKKSARCSAGESCSPLQKTPSICRVRLWELAINEDSGAYLALLSPRESHAVTFGFDRNEKGCVLEK